jgi:hypothetical protein
MGWKNSTIDELPKHSEEVLISVNGVNYIAIYNAVQKGFELRETKNLFLIENKEPIIYWKEIITPGC